MSDLKNTSSEIAVNLQQSGCMTCDLCTDEDRSVRREFNRQIDIPLNVDPKCLRSTLSKDGVLQVDLRHCACTGVYSIVN